MTELPGQVLTLIELALEEDLGSGDITSNAVFSDDPMGRAVIEAREPLVCCGVEVAREVFRRIDPRIVFTQVATEGEDVPGLAVLARLEGPVKGLLAGERTALNFMQRTCGVATQSRIYAGLADGRALILDSRKTVPGWRWLDKMAVRTGGCSNHRMGLFDGILIKDNHIAACGGIGKAVARARENGP
ncbi:MAG: nicotinate-nucleotide diphosphorylase (carboxylating), partial [Pseudomonadota bacterium]